jgi:hypothetical protein
MANQQELYMTTPTQDLNDGGYFRIPRASSQACPYCGARGNCDTQCWRSRLLGKLPPVRYLVAALITSLLTVTAIILLVQ